VSKTSLGPDIRRASDKFNRSLGPVIRRTSGEFHRSLYSNDTEH